MRIRRRGGVFVLDILDTAHMRREPRRRQSLPCGRIGPLDARTRLNRLLAEITRALLRTRRLTNTQYALARRRRC
jgi:hypothetical protein